MLTATLRPPVSIDEVRLWENKYPSFVEWAFAGCRLYCGYDLSQLPYSRQQIIFRAALNSQNRDRNGTRRTAAFALIKMARDFGFIKELVIHDKDMKRLAFNP